jgi:hypothetical protein
MKVIIFSIAIIVSRLIFGPELIYGQNKIDGYSINPKLGAFNWIVAENAGLIVGGEINMLNKKNIYSLDYFHGVIIMSLPEFNQTDLMIGKYIDDKFFRFQFQGGLGTFWGVKEGNLTGSGWLSHYEKDKYFTIGIPLKVGIKLIPVNFLSIGADFQANLNFKYPIYMTMFSIEIGKIRNATNAPQ